MSYRRWAHYFLLLPVLLITLLLSINLIVDPYSMTKYNILGIANKFARDDRVEKVARLSVSPAFDNMLFGSSRVYSMNPLVVGSHLGGQTYNAGVGTAEIEDHLGFLLFLERIDRLPRHVIIGLDLYTFNPEVETNKYFLYNKELNFLERSVPTQNYFEKFLSIDALRASIKTLNNHFIKALDRPRFDEHGALLGASKVFDYYPKHIDQDARFPQAEILQEYRFVKTVDYPSISQERLGYLQDIVDLCKRNDITLHLFLTPLYGGLLTKIEEDASLYRRLQEFKREVARISPYYDFITHNPINDTKAYFSNPTHATTRTGNLILARILDDTKHAFPDEFGRFVPLER